MKFRLLSSSMMMFCFILSNSMCYARAPSEVITSVHVQPISYGVFVGYRLTNDTDINVNASVMGFAGSAAGAIMLRSFIGESFYIQGGPGYAAYPQVYELRVSEGPGFIFSFGNEYDYKNGFVTGVDWLYLSVFKNKNFDSTKDKRETEVGAMGFLKVILGYAW